MKKIILIVCPIFIMSMPVFGALTAPYVGLNYGIQGANYFSTSGDKPPSYKPQFVFSGSYDLKLGKEVFFLGQLGLEGFGSGVYKYGDWIVGLGVGYYLFDYRENGRGSSMTLSFSYIQKFYGRDDEGDSASVISSIINDGYSRYGGQVSLSYYYNFFKYFALKVGASVAVHGGPVEYSNYRSKGIGIDYGLHIGIAI